jgi:hypothetical protein
MEERAYSILIRFFFVFRNIIWAAEAKEHACWWCILFMIIRRELRLHAWTLGSVRHRGVQADVRGATQVLYRGDEAVARGSCLSHLIDRGAQATARGAVPCASQVLGRGFEAVFRGAARCSLHVLDLDAQADASAVACGDATLPHQE